MPGSRGGRGSYAGMPREKGFRCLDPEGVGVQMPGSRRGEGSDAWIPRGRGSDAWIPQEAR